MTTCTLPPAVTEYTEDPVIGSLVVTIPNTADELLRQIDGDNDEWLLILIERRWFGKRELVRLPFGLPKPLPHTKVVRTLTWMVDRRAHIVGVRLEGPLPNDRIELHGDLEAFVIPGDIYNVTVALTERRR